MSKANRQKRQQARKEMIFEVESKKLLSSALPLAIDNPDKKIFSTHSRFCPECAGQMVARTQLLLKSFGYQNLIEYVPLQDFVGGSSNV